MENRIWLGLVVLLIDLVFKAALTNSQIHEDCKTQNEDSFLSSIAYKWPFKVVLVM